MKPSEVKEPTHWVELFGETILQAERGDSELSGLWTLLRYVMACNVVNFFGLPEHPIQPIMRDALADHLSFLQKKFVIQEGDEEPVLARIIANKLRDKLPPLCVACESDELMTWVRSVTYTQLSALASDDESKDAFMERAMAVPLLLNDRLFDRPPGEWRGVGFDLGNLSRDVSPSQPVGRPKKKSPTQLASAGSRSINAEEAKRAYRLSLDGKDRRAIARAIYPDLTPAQRRERKIEKKIIRLIERGELNAKAKKLGRNK